MDREHLRLAFKASNPSEHRSRTTRDEGVTKNRLLNLLHKSPQPPCFQRGVGAIFINYARGLLYTGIVGMLGMLRIELCRILLWGAILALSSELVMMSGAIAQIQELHLILNSDKIQSFASLVQEAEELAKSAIAREFQESPKAREVSILILGDRNGQIVPVLRSRVSRSAWQQNPNIESWTRYFSNYSEVLLSYKEPEEEPRAAPPPPPPNPDTLIESDPGFRDD